MSTNTGVAHSISNDNSLDSSRFNVTVNEALLKEAVSLFETRRKQHERTELRDTDIINPPKEARLKQTWLDYYKDIPHIDIPDLHQIVEPKSWKKFHTLQEWEGYILDVSEDEFTARLLDLTDDANEEDEEVTVPLSEIAETDHKHLYSGSLFRWVIGREYSERGTLRRVSEIIFRELPVMSASDRSDGQKWAKEIVESLNY